MTTATRSFWQVAISEPLELAAAQPHQVLISAGSIALMGQFAGSSGILHPFVGYLVAVGVEWAYLRGLASDAATPTQWGGILNWSAMIVVMLWGTLWVAQSFAAIPAHPTGWLGFALAFAHVGPIAWLSLCSAMCHRAAMSVQGERDRKMDAQRQQLALEDEAERLKMDRWFEAQQRKRELTTMDAEKMPKQSGIVPFVVGKTATCKECQTEVAYTTASEAGTIRRWGCESCRERRKKGV